MLGLDLPMLTRNITQTPRYQAGGRLRSATGLLTRIEATFGTLLAMERYRGHFYNWYDTRTLAPLAPLYISTVDSGNLAGYLVTLRAALLEIGEHPPPVNGSFLRGMEDLVGLVEEELARGGAGARGGADAGIRTELARLRSALGELPSTTAAFPQLRTLPKNQSRSRTMGPPMLPLASQFFRSVGGRVIPKPRSRSSTLSDVAQSPDVLKKPEPRNVFPPDFGTILMLGPPVSASPSPPEMRTCISSALAMSYVTSDTPPPPNGAATTRPVKSSGTGSGSLAP